ncbi:hypothetical protein [Catenulispora rubra]|uniref:hypothetical protein n=1 Tax=Catenulispora rubra TaxID=280293 RepID=UPI0018920B0D|nr:hypothetical protein [Catenulispora rubra]
MIEERRRYGDECGAATGLPPAAAAIDGPDGERRGLGDGTHARHRRGHGGRRARVPVPRPSEWDSYASGLSWFADGSDDLGFSADVYSPDHVRLTISVHLTAAHVVAAVTAINSV